MYPQNIKKLINSKASASEIKKEAEAAGMISLKKDGEEKVKSGLTSREEVLRVTQEE